MSSKVNMAKLDMPPKFLRSNPPTYDNGSVFLGYKVPAGQTFTSFSPSSDINAYLQAISGLSGWKQRQLLQSNYGTEMLNQAANGQQTDSVSFLGLPGFHSRASCQQDSDCGDNQICYAFNEQVFGPQQGPTCSPSVYPEIILGNQLNEGKPLRQYSNYCSTDDDCSGIDQFSGKKKAGMTCNHYYKGPSIFEKTGLCQVQYEDKGKRYHLKTPPGWVQPLNSKLRECNVQSDCGPGGVNGWMRCVGGSSDGKKYCTWPGQTYTPNPKQLKNILPSGMKPAPIPSEPSPTPEQRAMLNIVAEESTQGNLTPGGGLSNVSGGSNPPSSLVSGPSEQFVPIPTSLGKFK
jgi:hypothetical protein